MERIALCLVWLAESFARLRSPHPLEILTLRLRKEWDRVDIDCGFDISSGTEGDLSELKDLWNPLDTALSENTYLQKLERVVIPVSLEFVGRRRLLEQSLRELWLTRKLSFEWIDREYLP
ncbi:hypothetical protein DL96DRAFT_1623237 [Flagelloscypha sp. PMI_526]|nr:hypothetical protein DL96DRAFT_1623237 [Flagelloscypha sp. PMI_526]